MRTEDDEPRTAAVFYSLGNFGTEQPTLPLQAGLIGSVSLGDSGVTGMGWEPVVSVLEQGEPLVVPLEDPVGADATAEHERLRTHMGSGWRR